MALYEVVLNSSQGGQNLVNRFNYVSGGTPAGISPSLALAFAIGAIYDEVAVPPAYPTGTLLNAISNMCAVALTFQQVTVLNVYDPVDFYQTAFVPPYGGVVATGSAAPFVTMGFRTNVVNRSIGRGMKRFSGLSDNAEANNGVIDGGQLALMATTAERMSEILEYDDEGNTLTFSPAVCSKQKYIPDPEKPERTAYRYYATLAEQLTHTALGIVWESYPTVRSQTSRQYGRGS